MCTEEKQILSIRKMTEEDIEAVLAIDHRTVSNNRAFTYSSATESFMGGDLGISMVAESSGKIVGFLLGRIKKSLDGYADVASLEMIGIDPAYRRQGIGGKLLRLFMDRCKEKGLHSVRTIVSWHDWQLLSFLKSQKFHRGDMSEFVKPIE